jgi:hypothetical protein
VYQELQKFDNQVAILVRDSLHMVQEIPSTTTQYSSSNCPSLLAFQTLANFQQIENLRQLEDLEMRRRQISSPTYYSSATWDI